MSIFPPVALLIINYNGIAYTRKCLDSVRSIAYDAHTIFVLDNGSRENEAEQIRKEYESLFGDTIRIFRSEKNLGFAGGNNFLFEKIIADGNFEYCFLLNNDTEVDPYFINEAVAIAQQKKVAMVACAVHDYTHREKIQSRGIMLTRGGLAFERKDEADPLFCPQGSSALYSTALLKTIYEKTGDYFDNYFFCYEEEVDLGWRARLLGFECAYAPNAKIYHHGQATTGARSDFSFFYHYRNTALVLIKNWPLSLLIKTIPHRAITILAVAFYHGFFEFKIVLLLKIFISIIASVPYALRLREGSLSHDGNHLFAGDSSVAYRSLRMTDLGVS
ncbi:MAG: glycosyltransferase family 2 protein [Parcubacteria group bacterium]|nr:glycosyltransferase family 2 protein [Parcubacteria group bacterium]